MQHAARISRVFIAWIGMDIGYGCVKFCGAILPRKKVRPPEARPTEDVSVKQLWIPSAVVTDPRIICSAGLHQAIDEVELRGCQRLMAQFLFGHFPQLRNLRGEVGEKVDLVRLDPFKFPAPIDRV